MSLVLKGRGFRRAVGAVKVCSANTLNRLVIPSEARDLQLKREPCYFGYIMASRSLNLYTGITNNLYRRALEHKSGEVEGFTKRYRIDRLVYYETFRYVGNAIRREKQIKSWTRAKRLALIKSTNPTWQDLAEDWGRPVKLQIPRFARDDNPKENDNAKNNGGTAKAAPLQSTGTDD
jgi:putative endonuclease